MFVANLNNLMQNSPCVFVSRVGLLVFFCLRKNNYSINIFKFCLQLYGSGILYIDFSNLFFVFSKFYRSCIESCSHRITNASMGLFFLCKSRFKIKGLGYSVDFISENKSFFLFINAGLIDLLRV